MCTIMKKHAASLAYLEQARQHMSLCRHRSNTPTILVCGYPERREIELHEQGDESDVEVQPYAFTTKSIYVGGHGL